MLEEVRGIEYSISKHEEKQIAGEASDIVVCKIGSKANDVDDSDDKDVQ